MPVQTFLPATWLWLAGLAASAQVVLNEVMYHPPDDRDELQFIELHNAETTPVDLAGGRWAGA